MKTKLLILLILIVSSACKSRNKLNTDEQKLAAQIKIEEQEKQKESASSGIEASNAQDTFPLGIRYEPERSVDPKNPPEIIDIAGNINNIREFKLSDIASSIRYIRLQTPADSAFLGKLKNAMQMRRNAAKLKEELHFSIVKNKDFFVAYNHLGMLLYNSSGQLVKTICSNEFTGFSLYKGGTSVRSGYTFIGANGFPRLVGNKLYYNYEDNVNKISKMMEVDCDNISIPLPSSNENKNAITGVGNPIASTGERSYSVIPLSVNTFSKVGHPKRHEDMFTLYKNNGDTLCSFPGNQKIENYTKSVGRSADWGNTIYYKGNFYFREAHSDTIFKVIPPNRLIPAFIINLGEYKVDKIQDGMDPGFDLSNKFLPKSISITDKFVFIHYTKGYGSSNARKAKSVKFFHAIYNRKTKELTHVQHNPLEYEFALVNDLDGGLPVWPGSYSRKYFVPSSISEEGEIIQSVKGEVLKNYIKTDDFKNSNTPSDKKQKLVELANKAGDFETIIIEIK